MPPKPQTPGIVAGRLPVSEIADNFADHIAPYTPHEALVAADRCYFCYDAPCTTACPTSIDIPLFIRQIATGMPKASAETILSQNILGGMCARVCPTETLCEEVCVREVAEGKPVEIGRLQRFATDTLMALDVHPFRRAATTGKKVAIVGAGPAGLACAHRLAMLGHDVTIYEAKPKPGGLNEYGIAAYKSVNDFAQKEVEWLLQIGGICIEYGVAFGRDITLSRLREEFDAVFLGIGLGGVNALGLRDDPIEGLEPATAFIERVRQAGDLTKLPVGRRVVVIGGGMTAVDAAVQAKLLGAEQVTICYRRGRERMAASGYEQDHALENGVQIICHAQPVEVLGNGAVTGIRFAYTEDSSDGLNQTGETFDLDAEQVFAAIGQTLDCDADLPEVENGKIVVREAGQTSLPDVWAGGDCAAGGDDLTVTAVAEGRDAAMHIHATLTGAR